MAWYDLLPKIRRHAELALYCGNPECLHPVVEDDVVVYNAAERAIYHANNHCLTEAMVTRRKGSDIQSFMHTMAIDRKVAQRLVRQGKILQQHMDLEELLEQ